ncbi:low molecular weight protein-tyrosine-phosphatase [Synechocystis sp. PCC 7509]|uniref:low molecular weight protein-tyrosine-phosphatase n=1 Tax=Synechocystis sp. PCC 7509 TaxID=927677 RepID=UPI0002AC2DED|nr:low molecular weight protein-tyrosine-phosphatase [Synechocystis sp. PCC 7509]
MTYKLLFVCLGNICRSPTAENIMNQLIEQADLGNRISCDSAGTASYHVGNPPDRRMNAAAATKLGIELVGQARHLQPLDLKDFDLILAMDKANYQDILALDPTGKYSHKVHLMCEYCSKYSNQEVPDPYYGGTEGFNYVIDLLVDACTGLLEVTKK